MADTIPIPTSDEAQRIAMNQVARRHKEMTLSTGQKLAVVILRLNPAVTPANYAALGSAIDAIAGIDGVSLLIDGQTPVSIPAGTELRLVADIYLRIEPIPE